MGGTFDGVLFGFSLSLVHRLRWERGGVGSGGTCTLLGPEGPGAGRVSLWAGVVGGCFLVGLVWCHRLVVLGEVPPVL